MSTFATYPSLNGKVVFITGGAMGIGAALVEGFHVARFSSAFWGALIISGLEKYQTSITGP